MIVRPIMTRGVARAAVLLSSLAVVAAGFSVAPVLAAPGPSVVDYAQCANGQPPSTSLACPGGWINGILQASNSHYTEDQVTPQRAEISLPAGTSGTQTFTFKYQARKGSAQTHAYDSLATWNYTQTAADRCTGLTGTDCVGGAATTFAIPNDPQVLAPFSSPSTGVTSTHQLAGQVMTMYGGTITGVSVPVHDCVAAGKCNDASVDDYATVNVTFTITSAPKKVQLLFGGHLAVGSQGGPRTWGSGLGASNISGGPYHIKWDSFDGSSVGNRDNQIMGSAIIFVNTSIGTQVKKSSDNSSVTDGAHVALGTSVYDTATLSGNTSAAGGSVNYFYKLQTSTTADCTSGTALGTKTVSNAAIPSSDAVTLNTAGIYEFWAVYSGDGSNNTSTSTCGAETVIVDKSSTVTSTQVKDTNGTATDTTDDTNVADGGHVALGTSVYDTATVTGFGTVGGSVEYFYAATPTTCTTGTSLGTKTMSGGAVPLSNSVTLNTAGTYEFWAVYTDDTNNNSSSSTCGAETVIVDQSDTTTGTQIKNTVGTTDTTDDTNVADGGHVALGTTVYDTATVSGFGSVGGSLEYFYAATPTTCATGTSLGTKTVTAGVAEASNTVTLNTAGTYEFWAVYTDDANNNSSSSTCGAETVIVDKAGPGATTAQNLLPNDSATLANATATAGGTLTFSLFGPSDTTCSGTPAYTEGVSVSGNGTYDTTNATFLASDEGTWRWLVSYDGDSNNDGFTIACGVEQFTIDNSFTPSP